MHNCRNVADDCAVFGGWFGKATAIQLVAEMLGVVWFGRDNHPRMYRLRPERRFALPRQALRVLRRCCRVSVGWAGHAGRFGDS